MQQKTPYQPVPLPLDALETGQFTKILSDASAALARYDTLLSQLPNPNIILLSLQSEEAVMSSQIEGTQATFDEILRHDAGIKAKDDNKRNDIQEITNYREALSKGRAMLDEGYKINLTFVRGLHEILMSSARGANKAPGKIRVTQNWLGAYGSDINNASFIPPSPEQLPVHMDNWLAYLDDDEQETLIQTALMHAQFELLHPFLDGNGRLGRILIPLFLCQKKRISAPVFYISVYLEGRRDEYEQRLRNISEHGDWSGWVRFFLEASAAQAKAHNEKINKIKSLHEEMKEKIQKITHSQFINNIVDAIFTRPYFNTALFVEESGIPKSSAYNLLNKLENNDILESIRISFKLKIYRFQRLADILHNK